MVRFLWSERTWAIVSAVSGMVAALAATFTVYQAMTTTREDREAKRPYFTIEAPGIKPLPKSPPYRIQITMRNVGVHPATRLNGKILFVDANLATKPAYAFDFSVANDVPSGSPTPWYNDSLILPNDVPPMYVVLAASYSDTIIGKDYSQAFYMRWDGVKNGQTQPDFVHVSASERSRIEQALRTEIEGVIQRK
ncbi:MAG: hypothetical protein F9K13_06340 [Candidatus Methylomirabilis oxygeniifera]|uniref:Uncharacterized protein n=1 Tax=Methylomirabilis oxygeniifera TaxID=671143 RepID=D5MHV6_METO1|nr:MAG: hypothetical protein F9K13_06340 [Candidatus Methylomirabilis oxyfera]CBE69247.1 conserved exported protein of unknown function [Candidatus Methylomirabilis oxyfera]